MSNIIYDEPTTQEENPCQQRGNNKSKAEDCVVILCFVIAPNVFECQQTESYQA